MLTLKQSRRLNTLVVGLFAWAVALLLFFDPLHAVPSLFYGSSTDRDAIQHVRLSMSDTVSS